MIPGFEIVDDQRVNARATIDRDQGPSITLTRGLVEHFADQEAELALIIGHEYGHLIAAHIEEGERRAAFNSNVMSAALTVLAAGA